MELRHGRRPDPRHTDGEGTDRPHHARSRCLYPAAKFLKEFAVKDLIVVDDYCCGIAGSYGFKKEKHRLSMEIGSHLFKAIKDTGPSLVITDCGTCKVQIKDGTGISVKHPSVVLREYLKMQ
ncbi:MAG: hypothetical protein C4520_15580 [Candidatus Abyssobacteria bacterium SURF_5]|uniref:Cysteine-rich domain-containing protein n=1 Tax=Abyssobacteria bacterium (strain SURF_5) TaxID=2093360 RepID=A0A3A4NE12_ABYX5|nr:MAG: hypothetical protein C4520_15580 [Candidatus Abyssubacteria bacterium SURF_5]